MADATGLPLLFADAAGDLTAHGFDRLAHTIHGLAIALVGNAFAAPAMAALADRHGDDLGFRFRPARNGESAGDCKTLGFDRNDTRHIFLLRLCNNGLSANRQARPVTLNRTPC